MIVWEWILVMVELLCQNLAMVCCYWSATDVAVKWNLKYVDQI